MKLTRTAGVAVSTAATLLLTAAPAFADRNPLGPSEGADPGPGLSTAATIGLYVLVPLAIVGLVSALVLLPGLVRGTRYRPAEGWTAPPVWFAGPIDPVTAVAEAQPGDLVRGGGSGSW